MSAQLKTHLAVHGGGRTMIERWLIGKRMFNSKFTVMPDPQWITFLGFKIFKYMQYMCGYNSCKIIFFISLTMVILWLLLPASVPLVSCFWSDVSGTLITPFPEGEPCVVSKLKSSSSEYEDNFLFSSNKISN